MKTFHLLGVIAALGLAAPHCIALENEPARRDRLTELRAAVRGYGLLHPGKTPARVSQLVDENLVNGPAALMRPGAAVIPPHAELDARSDYSFEPVPGVADMLIRERAPLAGEAEVLAIFKDGTIKPLPVRTAPAGGTIARNDTLPPIGPPRTETPPPRQPAPPRGPEGHGEASRDAGRARPESPPLPPPRLVELSRAKQPANKSTRTSSGANPTDHSTPGEPVVITRPGAPADAYDIAVQAARWLQAAAGARAAQDAAHEQLPSSPTSHPIRVIRNADGTVVYAGTATATDIGGEARDGQRVITYVESPLPPGVAREDANAPWDIVGRMIEIDRRQGPRTPDPGVSDPGQPADKTLPGASLRPREPSTPPQRPGAPEGATWRVTKQFVQGLPWHSAPWSKDKAGEASMTAERAVRAKEYAKAIGPYTDFAGWSRAQNAENNYANNYLETVLSCQKQLGLSGPEVAYTHNNLGVVYTESRTWGAAEDEFNKALRIWEGLTSANSVPSEDYAVMLHNFAVLRQRQGNSAEAARLEAQAAAILTKRRAAGLP